MKSQAIGRPPVQINVLSLFAGAGGLDLAFESTGRYCTTLAIDSEAACIETLRLNAGLAYRECSGFLRDTQLMRGRVEDILDTLSAPSKPWVLIGGPPCQPFSAMGRKRNQADARSNGVLAFMSAVQQLRPSAFVMENVPRIVVNEKGAMLSRIKELAAEAGYAMTTGVLNAADYGAFTKRKRFFALGVPVGTAAIELPEEKYAKPSRERMLFDQLPHWRTCREALSDLEGVPSGSLPDHHIPKHTQDVLDRFRSLRHGQYDHIRKRQKVHPDRPCPSMIAGGSGGFIHHIHYLSRELTSRECARLQGFPDEFRFSGSPLWVAKQIVNAVPVELGAAVAHAVAEALHPQPVA